LTRSYELQDCFEASKIPTIVSIAAKEGETHDRFSRNTMKHLPRLPLSLETHLKQTAYFIAVGIYSAALTSCGGGESQMPPIAGQEVAGYAYVGKTDGIAQYTVSNGGTLTPMSPPEISYSTGGRTSFIAVEPSIPNLYAVNSGSGAVLQYTFGAGGGISTSPASQVFVAGNPSSFTFDTTLGFAYVTSYNGYDIAQFSVGATGALSPLSPATIAGLSQSPEFIAVDPVAPYVYVVSYLSVTQYTIDAGGQLSAASVWAVPTNNYGLYTMAIDPTGRYAYVTGTDAATVLQFNVGIGGALVPMNPPTVTTGFQAVTSSGASTSAVIDPTGRYLYVTNFVNSAVSQYTIGAAGALTPMNPATVGIPGPGSGDTPSEAFPYAIAFDKTGHYVYVACDDGAVFQYSISTAGALVPLNPAFLN
jgi:6-phosphogluconolactonase